MSCATFLELDWDNVPEMVCFDIWAARLLCLHLIFWLMSIFSSSLQIERELYLSISATLSVAKSPKVAILSFRPACPPVESERQLMIACKLLCSKAALRCTFVSPT